MAREISTSNTAFLTRRTGDPLDGYLVRWFHGTTGLEASLCGHASLAAAHVLFSSNAVPSSQMLRLHTRGGLVTCAVQSESSDGTLGPVIAADFPALSVIETPQPQQQCASLQKALGPGVPVPIFIGSVPETGDVFVCLESPETVRGMQPNMGALASLSTRGVIVTAAIHNGDGAPGPVWARGAHFVSRWFAPHVGVPEDAVTGSAHCALAPFWGARLGRTAMLGYQASLREGTIAMQLSGGGEQQQRVALIGRCATTLRGEVVAPVPLGYETFMHA